MRNPAEPDTQQNEYMPEAPNAHKQTAGASNQDDDGINSRDTSSMPRGEDDEETRAHSPEFHDRTDVPGAGTAQAPILPHVERE